MSKQLVLITGATGHLGFRTLVITLENGYRARVALRRLEQAEKLKNTASIKPYLDAIEFVHVPNITVDGAYTEALKGVDFVIHVASPIYSGVAPGKHDWKELFYNPAEKGTTIMLSAAAQEKSVKRVVVTSSVAAIEPKNGSDRAGPHDLKALPDDETLESFPAANQAYIASKVLSHLAGNKFMEKNSPDFDLIRVLPGYIQGANELYTTAESMKDEAILGSNEGTMFTALGYKLGHPRLTHQVFLDDVAKAHVFALKSEVAANGDNLLVVANNGDSTPWTEYAEVIKKEFPEAVAKGLIDPKVEDEEYLGHFDVASSEKALGFKFAGAEKIVPSVVGQYLRLSGFN